MLFPGAHADKRFVQLNGEGDAERLLDAGVDICSHERSMMHTRVITVDGAVASIGSANLHQRSIELDEECNLIVFDPDVVAVFDRHFDEEEHEVFQLAGKVLTDDEKTSLAEEYPADMDRRR